ncbi:MAG: DNA polymerase III subunit delta [Syntrophomonadaceae bacterium]
MRKPYSEGAVPAFGECPAVILVVGDVAFFVDEAASRIRKTLADPETEVLPFEDDAPAEAVSDALLNRSLFSPRRVVALDVSRLLGTEKPGALLSAALDAWAEGGAAGRRRAFKSARSLLAALDLSLSADPVENAEAAARRLRKKDEASALAEILRELPEEKGGGLAVLKAAVQTMAARGENDGTVALLTAVRPPPGVDLLEEIAARGLVVDASTGEDAGPALRRLAESRAREREVSVEPAAVERLLERTDSDPALFETELSRLLEWAGKGGRVRPSDVIASVVDESSEDVYGFFEAIGRRDAGAALSRIERLLEIDRREIRQGRNELAVIEEIWPQQLLGIVTNEIRRMLVLRARLDEVGGFDAGMSPRAFESRLYPSLIAPIPPFGRSPYARPPKPYALYMSSKRCAAYSTPELARALARAADVDVQLKNSAPVLETFSRFVGQLVAGA